MNKNLLNSIQLKSPNRNVFDLTHDHKTSCNMGELIPTMVMDVVPGDKVSLSFEALLRFQALVSPVMHRMHVYFHAFFVPNRILWEGWEDFIGMDAGAPAFPTVQVDPSINKNQDGGWCRLAGYLGIPEPWNYADPTAPPVYLEPETLNAMPFSAYSKIVYEYYRDQNLQEWDWEQLSNGVNPFQCEIPEGLGYLHNRAWSHDYFTSALPFAQKGAPVSIPIGNFDDVPVRFNLNQPNTSIDGTPYDVEILGGTTPNPSIDPAYLYADTSELAAGAASINDLRRAFRLQEFLEKNARGGTRYTEMILSHFGVRSSDARLQRPEYITGSKSPVVISEVLQTSETATSPQGNMAGHGISVTSGYQGSFFCEEHGYIICIMSVMPEPVYQQGIAKHWLKYVDRYQYFWPEFAHLGEQPIERREIFAYDELGSLEFGYTPRYCEYKYMNSRVSGDMATTLAFWHVGRIFETPPVLNSEFITCVPRRDIFAVTDAGVQTLICHILNKVRAVRPMPYFGTPAI